MSADINYDEISPGVRDLVRELNSMGYETTDSGDGSNHAAGMECALPFRHVFIKVLGDRSGLFSAADHLQKVYPNARIECSWSPGEPPMILLMPDGQHNPLEE